MIRNYLKIAWRNLWKHKAFTAMNLGALTISLSACMIIYFWINEELNYDRSGINADRVFRVALKLETANQPVKEFAVTSPLLSPVLVKDFPEIENAVRFSSNNPLLGYKDQHFYNDKFIYADSSFFTVFGYPLIKGNPETVLKDVNSIVISETAAKKYFGNEDPIGKIITMNDTVMMNVAGVAKDLPANNHFGFEIVASSKLEERLNGPLDGWWNDNYYTYLLLKDPAQAPALNTKIADIIDKYNAEQNKQFGLKGTHYLQPLTDIHLHSNLRAELKTNGNIASLRILGGIAIFLLIVACINYINLTTATSFKRAKEIGMRKVSGASFSQLIMQFLGEAMLIAGIALLLAIGVSKLCLPMFNNLAGTEINWGAQITISLMLRLIVFALLIGLAAGIYPAFYLSGIQPLKTIRRTFLKRGSAFSFRRVLVVFQFSLSIILIIGTIISLQQLEYMQTRKLGLNKDQVVSIPLRSQSESEAKELIKKKFREIAGITGVTASSTTPGRRLFNTMVLPEGSTQDRSQTMSTLIVDYDFFDTYKIEFAAGRNFSKEHERGDSSSFVLNETAVKALGWGKAEDAIGKGFNWGLGKEGRVIGVVKDFHFNSLQNTVQPLVMHIQSRWSWYDNISVRIPSENINESISQLSSSWGAVLPNNPFDYSFVDEEFDKQYQSEQRLSNLSMLFSVLIIFISCLGLLGLTMVAVSQRTKEIGVRKVLGASVTGITALLSKDFLKLVIIAFIISAPVAWWLMNKWLADFAYRVNVSWWVFAAAGVSALLIALVTVSFQSIRAAMANPVKSLRSE